MAPRILYLHGLKNQPGDHKHKILRELYGDSVTCPNLRTKQSMLLSGIAMALTLLWIGLVLWFCVDQNSVIKIVLSAVIFIIGSLVALGFLTKMLASFTVARAVRVASASYDSTEPNIIVTDGFASVVARRIARAKPAAIMFNPCLEKYARWTGDRSHRRMDSYPFIVLVDEGKPLADTYRTLERCDPERCKLELLEYNAGHPQISADEMQTFVDEAFQAGKQGATKLAEIDPKAAIPPEAF